MRAAAGAPPSVSRMERRLFEPLCQWSLEDVQALVSGRISEEQRLDYKQELQLARDKDRAELAKDVSGMANAQGGIIIYGVAEDGSQEPLPEEIKPVPCEGQQTRVEDILDSSVHPRLGYECRTLEARDGCVLVVRIDPASGGPHMVQGYKQHRYFVRRVTRTVPMSEDEIRAAYDAARTRADRLDELLAGLPLLPRIGRRRSADAFRMSAYGLTPPADGEWLPAVSVVIAPLRTAPELVPSTHIRGIQRGRACVFHESVRATDCAADRANQMRVVSAEQLRLVSAQDGVTHRLLLVHATNARSARRVMGPTADWRAATARRYARADTPDGMSVCS